MTERLDFRLLGPLEVSRGDELIDLGGHKQRSLLALFLIHVNRVVSTDRIIDALWGEEASEKENALWVYISRLRSVLEPERTGRGEHSVLVTKDPGYALELDPAQVDFLRFELGLDQARVQVETDPQGAVDILDEALGLWRGDPLDDLAYEDFTRNEVTRLSELRLEASELRVDASLALGQTGELVSGLQAFARENPYRERPVGQLMTALYRSGRQAEALRAYEHHRRILSDELGIDPSPELRLLEEQILLHDDRLAARRQTPMHAVTDRAVPNPYRGLHAFRESDQSTFFGRESLVAELLRRLDGSDHLIAVVGPSGSGKSSVVHAGLIPHLRKGALTAEREWVIAQMVPGAHPFDELEAALLRSRLDGPDSLSDQLAAGPLAILKAGLRVLPDRNARLLLVIDQFEELFTLVADRDVQRHFLEALVAAIEEPHGRITVVLTLRADFYDRPLLHPAFGARLGSAVVSVTPLSAAELEEAALQPAAVAGVRLEPTLLAHLITDVLDEPGALPMFQYTMTELFERREGDMLLESSYEEMGGVRGAITHRAEDLYRQLEPDQKDVARQLFLRLVKISDEQTWSRRRVPAGEIISLNVDVVALQEVIDRFGSHRLLLFDRDLVSGSPTVEVGHEALLSEWSRLEGWIREAGQDLLRHATYASYVEDWERSGRNPEYLVAGARLTEYEVWADASIIELNETELNFLSTALEQRELEVRLDEERAAREVSLAGRARRRLWALLAAVAALVIVVAAIAIQTEADKPRVALIQTGETGTDSMTASGLEEAMLRFDIVGATVTPPWTSVEDVERTQAEGGAALIIADAFLDVGASERLAAEFPDTKFAVFFLPGEAGLPNHVRYVFADEEAAYLAGVGAALESRTGTIGFVGALPIESVTDRLAGFEQGARSVDPSIGLIVRYLSTEDVRLSPESGRGIGFLNRPDLGREAALELFAAGADIIYHAAGDSGLGVFQAARETTERTGTQVWGIGSDSDQSFDVPANDAEYVLMSTIRRFDAAVIDAVEMVATDQFQPGTRLLDLANGGIGYVATEGRLARATVSAIDVATKSIVNGEVVFQLSGRPAACTPVPNRGPDESGYDLVAGGRLLTVAHSSVPESPYRVVASDGSLLGFEPALLNAIAARIGLQVQYVEAPLEALIRCVSLGSFDAAMHRFSVTPRIEEMVTFSSPYLRKPAVIMTSEASGISTVDDMVTVVVMRNTQIEETMRANYPALELVVAANPVVPPIMVEAGEVDGWAAELTPDLIASDALVVVESVSEAFAVFPVNPALGDLVTDMNVALAQMIGDGEYQQIYARFFDTAEFSVDQP